MRRTLLVGNRAIQHAMAARLLYEGANVDVYPGQEFGGYSTVDAAIIEQRSYDIVVAGSARYFNDPVVIDVIRRGARLFGATPETGCLETSKMSFKQYATRWGIKVPAGHVFYNYDTACSYIEQSLSPYVIKADGPARGCGVSICYTVDEAKKDLHLKLRDKSSLFFSGCVVIEEFIPGPEIAVNIIFDDHGYLVFPPTRPHKRRNVGDTGPNVAGMGSFTPLPINDRFFRELEKSVIHPTLEGICREGWHFRGCIFANFILTEDEIVTLEFNCRFGDPAMLVNLLQLKSSFDELLAVTTEGRLTTYVPKYRDGVAVAVTLIDPAYPDSHLTLDTVSIPQNELVYSGKSDGLLIAGTSQEVNGVWRVNSGVVASSVAIAKDFNSARGEAYRRAAACSNLFYRSDIGLKIEIPDRFRA